MVDWAAVLKEVLSTRLSEEVYGGLIGVMQTLHSTVPNKQIENALVNDRNDDFISVECCDKCFVFVYFSDVFKWIPKY